MIDPDSRPRFKNLVNDFSAMARDPPRYVVIQVCVCVIHVANATYFCVSMGINKDLLIHYCVSVLFFLCLLERRADEHVQPSGQPVLPNASGGGREQYEGPAGC